jgi:hypothetical protein
VRFGHFNRGSKPSAPGLLTYCNFWNFGVSIIIGFSVWAGCIFLRFLRLHHIFFRETDKFEVGPLLLDFKRDWKTIFAVLLAPFWIVYTFVFPMSGAVELKTLGQNYFCIYRDDGPIPWAILDGAVFFCIWIVLIFAAHTLRDVDDDFGERRGLTKALKAAVASLAAIVLVEIFELDGIWIGRSMVTAAVCAAVASFFYVQNAASVRTLLREKEGYPSDGAAMTAAEQKRYEQALCTEDEILEGGGAFDSPKTSTGTSLRKRGATMSSKTQKLFAKSVLTPFAGRKED